MLRLLWGGLKGFAREPLLKRNRKKERIVRPMVLDYAVTWRCNARCIMCDTWQAGADNPELAAAEMKTAELESILDRDRDFLGRVSKIGLTGGEPFLRPDLVELVRVLHRALPETRISVVSNGLMTKRILRALAEIHEFLPGLIFSVSLDGMGPVHDKVRGIPGAYEKAMATIKGALELGFTVTSGMTISEVNYNQVEPVSGMLGRMGVDFSCNLQERGANFHNDGQAGVLTASQSDQVIRALEPFGHHYYMDNVRRQLAGAKRTLPCYSGLVSYFIHPGGNVAACNLIAKPLGNLREQSFAGLASSRRAWDIRHELEGCTCWSQCEVKNSAAAAPWHVFKWMVKNPRKGAFFRHYAKKAGLLPQ